MANEIHISGSGVTIIGRPLHINGNGINRTKIVADNYFVLRNNATGNVININDCCINFAVDGPNEASTGTKLSNVLIDGATTTSSPNSGGESIVGCATEITGSTFKNCRFAGVVGNQRGVVDGFPLVTTITNCLFLAQATWMSAVFCYGTTITGSTFATGNTGNVAVYNRATPTYIDKCVFVGTGIGGTGWQITESNYVWIKLSNTTITSGNITTQNTLNLLQIYGHNTFNNVTISGPGRIGFEAGSVTESTDGTGWRINLSGSTNRIGNYGEISGCTITGKSYSTGCLYLYGGSRLVNSLITGNAMTVNASQVEVENNASKSPVLIKGSSITGNTRGSYGGAFDALTTNGRVLLVDSTVDGCYINPSSRTWIYFNNITFPRVGYLYNEIGSGQYSYYAPSVRIEDGSTVSVLNNTRGDTWGCMQSPCIAVGVQSSDGTFFANNGTFTFVKKNGTSTQIKGIGTYVRMDGVNDFSPIYQITSTAASGSGSLQYGILTATEKWLVPMPNISTTEAVVSTATTNKPVFFMNAAGAPIFGGSISLPASTTVSCKYDNNIEASTVSVTGGTLTVSGTCYMRGSLTINTGMTIASSTSIIGDGTAGSIIVGGSNYIYQLGQSGFTLKYLTIRRVCFENSGSMNLVNCNLYRQDAHGQYLNALIIRSTGTCTNCYFDGGGGTIIHSDGSFMYFKNCTFTNGGLFQGGSPSTIDGCSFNGGNISISYGQRKTFMNNNNLVGNLTQTSGSGSVPTGVAAFDKYNKWSGCYNPSVAGGTVCLISGSTLNLQGNSNANIFRNVILKVGTISGNAITVTGSAIIITTSGTTYTVSGSGTYLNNDGTTDLTRA